MVSVKYLVVLALIASVAVIDATSIRGGAEVGLSFGVGFGGLFQGASNLFKGVKGVLNLKADLLNKILRIKQPTDFDSTINVGVDLTIGCGRIINKSLIPGFGDLLAKIFVVISKILFCVKQKTNCAICSTNYEYLGVGQLSGDINVILRTQGLVNVQAQLNALINKRSRGKGIKSFRRSHRVVLNAALQLAAYLNAQVTAEQYTDVLVQINIILGAIGKSYNSKDGDNVAAGFWDVCNKHLGRYGCRKFTKEDRVKLTVTIKDAENDQGAFTKPVETTDDTSVDNNNNGNGGTKPSGNNNNNGGTKPSGNDNGGTKPSGNNNGGSVNADVSLSFGVGFGGLSNGVSNIFGKVQKILNLKAETVNRIRGLKQPTTFDATINVGVDLSIGCGRIINKSLIPGFGDLMAKIYIVISKILFCVKQQTNYGICSANYLGVGQISGDINVILQKQGLVNVQAQLNALINKYSRGKGIKYYKRSQRVVLNAALKLAAYLNAKITVQQYTDVLVQINIILGAIGKTYNAKDGQNLARGFWDICIKNIGQSRCRKFTKEDRVTLTVTVQDAENDEGAFSKTVETTEGSNNNNNNNDNSGSNTNDKDTTVENNNGGNTGNSGNTNGSDNSDQTNENSGTETDNSNTEDKKSGNQTTEDKQDEDNNGGTKPSGNNNNNGGTKPSGNNNGGTKPSGNNSGGSVNADVSLSFGVGFGGLFNGVSNIFGKVQKVLNLKAETVNRIRGLKQPTTFDATINVGVDLSIGCGRIINKSLIPGFGDLMAKIYIVISKILFCVKQQTNYGICSANYLGVGQISGDINVILQKQGLVNVQAQLNALINKYSRGKGIKYYKRSQRVVLNAALKLAAYLNAKITVQQYTDVLVQINIILGAIGKTYNAKDGQNLARGFWDICIKNIGQSRCRKFTKEDRVTLTVTVQDAENDEGAFSKTVETTDNSNNNNNNDNSGSNTNDKDTTVENNNGGNTGNSENTNGSDNSDQTTDNSGTETDNSNTEDKKSGNQTTEDKQVEDNNSNTDDKSDKKNTDSGNTDSNNENENAGTTNDGNTDANTDTSDKTDKDSGTVNNGSTTEDKETVNNNEQNEDNSGKTERDSSSEENSSSDEESRQNQNQQGGNSNGGSQTSAGINIRLGGGVLVKTVGNLFGIVKNVARIPQKLIDILINLKAPTNFDESININVQLTRGCSSILDNTFIQGFGTLLAKVFILISKISVCLKGGVSCSLCSGNYYNIGQVSGNIDVIIKNAGLTNCQKDLQVLIDTNSKGKGLSYYTPAERIVIQSALELTGYLNAKITKQTFTLMLKPALVIYGTIGNSVSVQDNTTGDNLTGSLIGACGRFYQEKGFGGFKQGDLQLISQTVSKAKADKKAAWCVRK